MVLIDLSVKRVDLALPEGIVQSVIDALRRDAKARSSGPVDGQGGGQAIELLVRRDVRKLWPLLQALEQLAHHGGELIGIGILERVLVLSATDTVVNGQILDRLHVKLDARHLIELRSQTPDDIGGGDPTLCERLEIDLNAAAVQGSVGSIGA